MSLSLYPGAPLADGSCLVAFDGQPGVGVVWSVVNGPGHITGQSPATDASGRAWAVYTPDGGSGVATIEVSHGT